LFFLNAVYQDDAAARPYPMVIHRFIYLGVALLPIYSAIAFYGLSLRVEQYGWSVDRCWGFLLWGFFALFSLGYLWGIIKQRDHWLEHLSWVNVRMGLVLLAVMLLINSPLIDFRKISVSSQLNQLASDKVSLADFDFTYFRYGLARPGYLALQKIKADVAEEHPAIALKIDHLYRDRNEPNAGLDREMFLRALKIYDEEKLPEALLDALHKWINENHWRATRMENYHLVRVDLNKDSLDDYVLLQTDKNFTSGTLFTLVGDKWEEQQMTRRGNHRAGEHVTITRKLTEKYIE